jgi:hypothetical protein
VLAMASPALADYVYVQMRIDPTSVTWNNLTGVMTVELTFVGAGGHTDAVTAFGSEMYLTGADGQNFTPLTGLYGASTATMIAAAGTAGYAWSTFGQSVVSGTDPNAPGSGGAVFDHNSLTPGAVAINSVADGAVTALYAFHYNGNRSDFTEVNAWVVADAQAGAYDPNDPNSWAYVNFNTPADAVQIANEGVSLIPEPATMGLLGFGLTAVLLRRRRSGK